MIPALFLVSALRLGAGLASAADMAATELALRHDGMREANPFMGESTAGRVALKAATTAAVLGASHVLERRGRKGWAKAVLVTALVAWGGAAVWNTVQIRKEGDR